MSTDNDQPQRAAARLARLVVDATATCLLMVVLAMLLTGVGFALAVAAGGVAATAVVVFPRVLGWCSAWSQWQRLKKRLAAGDGDPRDLLVYLQRVHPRLYPDPAGMLVKQTCGTARIVNGWIVRMDGAYASGLIGRLLVSGVAPEAVLTGMRAGLTEQELAGHFDGKVPLDWGRVEFLAALRAGEQTAA